MTVKDLYLKLGMVIASGREDDEILIALIDGPDAAAKKEIYKVRIEDEPSNRTVLVARRPQ